MAKCSDDENIPEVDADDTNAQATIPCGDCGETKDVFSYCLGCPWGLCDVCKPSHERKIMTKAHKIVPYSDQAVDNLKNIAAQWKCERHRGYAIVSYCVGCDRPCCRYCVDLDHKEHKLQCICDTISDAKCDIELYIQTNEKTIKTVSEDIANTERAVECEEGFAKEAVEQLDTVLKDMHIEVDREMDKCKTEMRSQSRENIDSLRRIISKRQQEKSQCENLICTSRQVLVGKPSALVKFFKEKPRSLEYQAIQQQQLPSVKMIAGNINVKTVAERIQKAPNRTFNIKPEIRKQQTPRISSAMMPGERPISNKFSFEPPKTSPLTSNKQQTPRISSAMMPGERPISNKFSFESPKTSPLTSNKQQTPRISSAMMPGERPISNKFSFESPKTSPLTSNKQQTPRISSAVTPGKTPTHALLPKTTDRNRLKNYFK